MEKLGGVAENLENPKNSAASGKIGLTGKSAESFRSMENLENLRILYSCGKFGKFGLTGKSGKIGIVRKIWRKIWQAENLTVSHGKFNANLSGKFVKKYLHYQDDCGSINITTKATHFSKDCKIRGFKLRVIAPV